MYLWLLFPGQKAWISRPPSWDWKSLIYLTNSLEAERERREGFIFEEPTFSWMHLLPLMDEANDFNNGWWKKKEKLLLCLQIHTFRYSLIKAYTHMYRYVCVCVCVCVCV